ncbi:MAG: M28 family peptidase [Xanthomonadales bacterium]|nr:M28 family peptidase [Xanthomonadales bacterium]
MKVQTFTCLFCALFAASQATANEPLLSDDNIKTAKSLAAIALASDHAYILVRDLTTKVGPRLAGSAADKRAVAWAKSSLEDAGFDLVKLEPVDFPVWKRKVESARVVAPYPQELKVSSLGFGGSTHGELVAPVVSFGSLSELEVAAPEQVAGKIVFMNRQIERSRTGEDYGDAAPIRYQSNKFAKEKGAKALLIRSLGTGPARFAHTGAMTYDEHNTNLPGAALSRPDADQLERILESGQELVLGLNLDTEQNNEGGSFNVVADIVGSEKPEEIILLGAHLDSWDVGTGALDDGVGVAIVIGTGQLIASLPKRPSRTIRVVLFANEEQGGWGAKQYAKVHAAELQNHIAAAEPDMGAGRIWQFETQVPATWGSMPEELAGQLSFLGIERGGNETRGGPDLKPLKDMGVPIIGLNQDATYYFDYHHTDDDTLDKIDPAALRQSVAAYVIVSYLLADMK